MTAKHSARLRRRIAGIASHVLPLAALLLLAGAAMAAPQRVVSLNLCTDELAMLVAAEGQLHSVSDMALDENVSVLAERARGLVANHGLAEEIFLMKPDLVLAGSYTARPTTDMLKRLGFRVELFEPAMSFADIRAQLRRIGALLRREATAENLVRRLDATLAAVQPPAGRVPLVAFYYANQYTAGSGTLVDDVIRHSGSVNLGAKLGLSGTQKLSLEQMIMARPDLIAMHNPYKAPALAYEAQLHPAFRALSREARLIDVPDRYTICGGPFTATAVRILAASR